VCNSIGDYDSKVEYQKNAIKPEKEMRGMAETRLERVVPMRVINSINVSEQNDS